MPFTIELLNPYGKLPDDGSPRLAPPLDKPTFIVPEHRRSWRFPEGPDNLSTDSSLNISNASDNIAMGVFERLSILRGGVAASVIADCLRDALEGSYDDTEAVAVFPILVSWALLYPEGVWWAA